MQSYESRIYAVSNVLIEGIRTEQVGVLTAAFLPEIIKRSEHAVKHIYKNYTQITGSKYIEVYAEILDENDVILATVTAESNTRTKTEYHYAETPF